MENIYVFQDYYLENNNYLPVMASFGEESYFVFRKMKFNNFRGCGDNYYSGRCGDNYYSGNGFGYGLEYGKSHGDGYGVGRDNHRGYFSLKDCDDGNGFGYGYGFHDCFNNIHQSRGDGDYMYFSHGNGGGLNKGY